MGETGRPHGAEERVDVGESVLYLFYLRLVLLAHQLVRGRGSGRWWVDRHFWQTIGDTKVIPK